LYIKSPAEETLFDDTEGVEEMIQIRIKTVGSKVVEIRISGHGGGKKNRDIVCAAVSAVGQTGLAGLLHYCRDEIEWEKANGLLSMRRNRIPDGRGTDPFEIIANTVLFGLREIAGEYPMKVRISSVDDSGITDKT
jgi:uncharacterized protein YsxB (DUF464 family)